VLGIDGSGKSTLARELALSLSAGGSACLISDGLELYAGGAARALQPLPSERLREWMGSRAKRAGSLARYKIPKLAEMLLRDHLLDESRRWYAPDWVVMDGAPLLNMTAWAVLYREDCFGPEFSERALGLLAGRERLERRDPLRARFPELGMLDKLGLLRLHVPDRVLLLEVPAQVAVSRIAARGGLRQVHETEEKLDRLSRAYAMVCDAAARKWGLPALRLDGTRAQAQIAAEALAWLQAPVQSGQEGSSR
jgi:thymidylate kinase